MTRRQKAVLLTISFLAVLRALSAGLQWGSGEVIQGVGGVLEAGTIIFIFWVVWSVMTVINQSQADYKKSERELAELAEARRQEEMLARFDSIRAQAQHQAPH